MRLEHRIPGLTYGFGGTCVRSRGELILAGESVKDSFAPNLKVGEVDRLGALGFGLGRCELCQHPVRPRGVEMVQVNREDPA
jgi:hypothetical protein